ncbi:hypothetical protein [Sphingobium estronivorans]|uniref:hypothetical protein n=1 Tax=Sphingobium estronivorans TaxID=1577690 RepID=UPI0013C2C84F|nr:hypothetical protein [Sphingobium estronivorans]
MRGGLPSQFQSVTSVGRPDCRAVLLTTTLLAALFVLLVLLTGITSPLIGVPVLLAAAATLLILLAGVHALTALLTGI